MVSIARTSGVPVLLYCRFYVLHVQLSQIFTSVTLLCSTTATSTELTPTLRGGGVFFPAGEDLGRMFNHSFPA